MAEIQYIIRFTMMKLAATAEENLNFPAYTNAYPADSIAPAEMARKKMRRTKRSVRGSREAAIHAPAIIPVTITAATTVQASSQFKSFNFMVIMTMSAGRTSVSSYGS